MEIKQIDGQYASILKWKFREVKKLFPLQSAGEICDLLLDTDWDHTQGVGRPEETFTQWLADSTVEAIAAFLKGIIQGM